MTIDAHQHFWMYDPLKYKWIDDTMAAIRYDFMPSDLWQVYNDNNIDGCVAIQAVQTLEETNFLITQSDEFSFIKGVIGWVDLRAHTLEAQLEQFSRQAIVKGFRHIVQGEPDPNFLLQADFLNGVSCLKKYNYTYDILVYPHQLGEVLEFVRHFPDQKFVLDHLGKPYIKEGHFDGWAVLVREIASAKNVYCKLSGMVTEADYHHWTPSQMMPYIELVLESFGTERIMFGSDWPVCLLAADYATVKQLVTDAIAKLSLDEQASIMGQNAINFYNLQL